MKIPKEMKRYCPKCNKHTVQKVKQEKNRGKNKTHPMSAGSRSRVEARGLWRGFGNMGKYSKGAINKWKRYNKKRTKKTDLRYECTVCKYTTMQKSGIRVGKLVFE